MNLIKQITPPIIWRFLRKYLAPNTSMWSGNFRTWDDAFSKSTGYNKINILNKCKEALLKIKNGQFQYERDGVLFEKIQYSWPLSTLLLKTVIEKEGNVSVLDFGGSLGSSYFQNRSLLGINTKVFWAIIEQPAFVEVGKNFFETDELFFFKSLNDLNDFPKPDILLLSSVLQYLPNPYNYLKMLSELNIKYIILDRTAFNEEENDLLTIQTVPKEIYDAKYPAWFLSLKKVREIVLKNYTEIAFFESYCDKDQVINNGKNSCIWRGMIFIQNDKLKDYNGILF